MLYLQIKYARIVGVSVERWKIKKESPFHGNGRCPVCGDSATSKVKCRFHIREHNGVIFVSCFNCGLSTSLVAFMKLYHVQLYSEYVFERYRSGVSDAPCITDSAKPPVFIEEDASEAIKGDFFDGLTLVSEMDSKSPVARYVASRGLPKYPFAYTDKFFDFSSRYNSDLVGKIRDEPRLIIPFFDRSGNVFAYQGRDLSGKSSLKYITITVNPKVPKIFGIDRVDFKQPVLLVEGPIDSLFLPNCLASVNASLVSTAKKLESIIDKKNITLVYDCEPRNKVICSMYENSIKEGYKVVIWPSHQKEKDINDLIIFDKNPEEIIKENTYSGLMAEIQFKQWKRI